MSINTDDNNANNNNENSDGKIPPLPKEKTIQILNQLSRCVGKIYKDGGEMATVFFCKIPYPDQFNLLPFLITNYHVLHGNDLRINKTIKITFDNDRIEKLVIIDETRIVLSFKDIDVSMIEIKPEIDIIHNFLDIDENIYLSNYNEFYKINKFIYILHYPEGKSSHSIGLIKDINNEKIEHDCGTKKGSSGGPILSVSNLRVLGIHKGSSDGFYNEGTFIKNVIDELHKAHPKKKNTINNTKKMIKNQFGNRKEIPSNKTIECQTLENVNLNKKNIRNNDKNIKKININKDYILKTISEQDKDKEKEKKNPSKINKFSFVKNEKLFPQKKNKISKKTKDIQKEKEKENFNNNSITKKYEKNSLKNDRNNSVYKNIKNNRLNTFENKNRNSFITNNNKGINSFRNRETSSQKKISNIKNNNLKNKAKKLNEKFINNKIDKNNDVINSNIVFLNKRNKETIDVEKTNNYTNRNNHHLQIITNTTDMIDRKKEKLVLKSEPNKTLGDSPKSNNKEIDKICNTINDNNNKNFNNNFFTVIVDRKKKVINKNITDGNLLNKKKDNPFLDESKNKNMIGVDEINNNPNKSFNNINDKNNKICVNVNINKSDFIIPKKYLNNNNKKEVIENDTKKEIFEDGFQIVHYNNGDKELIYTDGKKVHYCHETKEIHTIFSDGRQISKLSNGQINKVFANKEKIIYYPDGAQMFVKDKGLCYVNGSFERKIL